MIVGIYDSAGPIAGYGERITLGIHEANEEQIGHDN